jgi:periplasmic protein CpxP/Spy
MNKKIITIALALALPFAVFAFPGGQDGDHSQGHKGDRVERLTKQLDLTPEQTSQLTQIFQEQQAKREAIRQETDQRLQTVLTPEQMTKFEELKKQRHEKWQKRHQERKDKSAK